LALKLVLMLATQKGGQNLQMMRDSQVIINFLNWICAMENFLLRPISKEALNFKDVFNEISCFHVYRERNTLVDTLSKEILQMAPRTWHVWERQEGFLAKYDPRHFFLFSNLSLCTEMSFFSHDMFHWFFFILVYD
jgi:hypothetical protein